MQSKYVGNKHRHVWLAATLTRNSRLLPGLLGHWVGKLGWLVGYLVGCLFAWLVWLLGRFVVWLAGWLVNGLVGYLVWRWVLLLVGLVGSLPVLAGWFGSTRQRLVPSPGALTEGSGRGPGFTLLEKQEKQFPRFMFSFGLNPRAFAWKRPGLGQLLSMQFWKNHQKHRDSANR